MAKADLWMPLWISDYQADTSRLSLEHHGAYLLLLMDYWRNGALPDDDDVLARVLGIKPLHFRRKIRAVLAPFFTVSEGRWTHKRVEAELAAARANADAAKEKASRAARARWSKEQKVSMLGAMPEQCPPPSPSSVPTEQRQAPADPNKEGWSRGVALLVSKAGMGEPKARRFFGKLLGDHGLEARDLLPSIVRAENVGTADPQGYLTACAKKLQRSTGVPEPEPVNVAAWDLETWRGFIARWRAKGELPGDWPASVGPMLGQSGCLVPAELRTEA